MSEKQLSSFQVGWATTSFLFDDPFLTLTPAARENYSSFQAIQLNAT
jgi:hypothetical protein